MIAINKMKLLRIRHAHVWLGLMMLIIQICLRSERNWPTRLLLSLPHPEFWLMIETGLMPMVDVIRFLGEEKDPKVIKMIGGIMWISNHLAIYQSALLVFGHRSPVSWPSTHPIPTWGRFPKRIHRKVFCRPMFSCPPKPYFDPLTCFRCQLNSAWGDSKSK